MCAERIQRLLMAAILFISMILITNMSIWGLILQGFVIFMLIIWAFTDFCPSIWFLRKITKPCK